MRLQSYLKESSSGEDMEVGIVSYWEEGKIPTSLNSKISEESVSAIVSKMKKIGISGDAKKIGSVLVPVSTKWKEYGYDRNTSVPKTDIIIGNDKISLKTGQTAQLMSGGKDETVATFYAAIESSGVDMVLYNNVINKVKKFKHGAVDDVERVGLGKLRKLGQLPPEVEEVYQIIDEISEDIENTINTNDKFSKAFAYEAMTGKIKFGNSIGTAEYMLSVDWSGNTVKYHKCSDESYISYIANQMKPNVSLKTSLSGTRRNYTVALRLEVGKLLKVPENTTNESIISDIWKQIKDKIVTFYQFIIGSLKKEIRYFINVMGFEPDIIVNSEVTL